MTFLQNSFICDQSLFSLIPSALSLEKERVKNGSEINLLCIKKDLVFKWWMFVFSCNCHLLIYFRPSSFCFCQQYFHSFLRKSSLLSCLFSAHFYEKHIVLAAKKMTYTYSKGNIHWLFLKTKYAYLLEVFMYLYFKHTLGMRRSVLKSRTLCF